MFEQGQNQRNLFNGTNGRDRANLTLLILILGLLSLVSIGIMVLAMLRQMYPKVFAAPGIAKMLNYQGKLQDADGITVPDGSYSMKFTIYDAASGGNALWSARESDACGPPINPGAKSISVYNGVFSTLLGESGDCPITLDFNDDAYYLGVTVGTDPEMTPRKRIGAAGYAFNADLLDGLNTSASGGSNAFVPVTDSSGNFVLTENVNFDSNTFFLDSANDNIGIGIAPSANRTIDLITSKQYGLYSETSSDLKNAAGVYGITSYSGHQNYGGYFVSGGNGGSAGVYGYASNAAAAPSYGGYFVTEGVDGYGVYAAATSSSGTFGVYGVSSGTGAITNWGGYFVASGDNGQGVYGVASTATEGPNYGGYFRARGTKSSTGIYGEASNAGAYTNYGGDFLARGQTGIGVRGVADNSSAATNYGGYFTAAGSSGRGVYGEASATGGFAPNYGGYFLANGAYGVGVYGKGKTGVHGFSDFTDGRGVSGIATDTSGWLTIGGNFISGNIYPFMMPGNDNVGVFASGSSGSGTNTGWGAVLLGDDVGVYARQKDNWGKGGWFIAGGDLAYGVYGEASGDGSYGVYGLASGLGEVAGVRGEANASGAVTNYGGIFTAAGDSGIGVATSAPAFGIHAIASGANGVGIQGWATDGSGTNYGVKGVTDSSAGWAGHFTGGQGVYANKAKIGPATTAPAENLDVVGNIANLANSSFNPVLKGSVATGGYPRSVYVSGRYAYVVHYNDATLHIYDVSDPANPEFRGTANTGALPKSVYVSGRYAYVANFGGNTLEIFDVSNPVAPVSVGSAGISGMSPSSVYVSGHYTYVAEYNGQLLEIFDVSNPTLPLSVGFVATSGKAYDVYVSGRYAYVVSNVSNTLEIFDVSNPTNPTLVGSETTGSTPTSVYISGRYAYVTNLLSDTLEIFDISDPSDPERVGFIGTDVKPISVHVSGRYAYVVNQGDATLQVFDVSDPSNPVEVGSVNTFGPQDVYVSGRYAYVVIFAALTSSLEVFDISGLETTSAMVHSLEVGNLQVKNDIIAQGEIQTKGGISALGSGFFGQGIAVLTAESSGRAVYGRATATGAAGAVGGYFVSDADAGTAVIGRANGSGLNFGGDFRAEGPGGYGVRGISASVSNTIGYGVYGETYSEWGVGVQGNSIPVFPNTAGIGVYGYTTATATGSAGVKGIASGTGAYGVFGEATDSFSANYGGYFKSYGQGGGAGVYGTAVYSSNWAGYFTGGAGLYAGRLSIAETSTSVAYNTIGPAAAGHTGAGEIEDASDLFIADDLEVDGYAWLDGGHPDIAEMIAYSGQGEAGDVIVIDEGSDNTAKLATKPYDQNVIGVISTKPSLVITGNIKEGKLLAVAGRVPTKVTNINGPIARGDLLTTSAVPGHAMKATEPGPIVGKALEPCNQNSCTIWVFLNVGWYGGVSTASGSGTLSPSTGSGHNLVLDKLTADLDASGFAINDVLKIVSKDEVWSIDENGLLKVKIKFERDKKVLEKEIYALSSTSVEVVLSGSSRLEKGQALVDFSQIDQDFIEIIDQTVPLKISVTPTEDCQGVFVAEKYPQGFKVKELNNGVSNAAFDWIVIGRRKDTK